MRDEVQVAPRASLAIEAVVTGALLGLAQTSLGFALLLGAGASALLFFALTAAWIAGGALGASGSLRLSAGARSLGLALFAFTVARAALAIRPFHPLSTALGLVAGVLAGAYAGTFLRDRAPRWGSARALLLYENNGFIAGIAAAGALLFVSSRALDAAVALLGAALLARLLRAPR